ncbi:MAG: sigma-54 dependent transcriptional regulator [Bacteroidales bacterium]|nr:sigma-54 dependent transcriptional regulator [Bacteroidales bacterium]
MSLLKSDRSDSILVIDDDNDVLYTARLVLRGLFSKVDVLDRPGLIPEYLKACKYDVILLDMNFTRGSTSGKEGLEWLGKILRIDPEACVLTTTAYGEIDLAVQAMKMGAVDFLIKPWNKEQLVASVHNVLSLRHAQTDVRKIKSKHVSDINSRKTKSPEIISRSPVMVQILEIIKTVAPTDANVLMMGESGTGKELAARALHNASLRSQKPFVHVDLGAIPETLFESELFGHTRGAFTDAREDRAGRFEIASDGTLFLDEIGNLSLPLQAKILTAIQNREVVRIGSNHPLPVNVRLISATNMPLYKMADSFEFRQDLLYRINTVEITLPPLRERREDISPIADYYLKFFSDQYGKKGITIKEETIEKLKEYHWPGNIRELAHSIERAVILNKSGTLAPDDFILKIKSAPAVLNDETGISVEDYEKKAISNALSRHNGNLSKAADELGIARSTLYRKIARFGIGQ